MNDNYIEQLLHDQKARKVAVRNSHYLFFHIYFPEYVKYQTAPFQKEIFSITEDEDIKNAVIVAFRGSAKSTIMTFSYPLWAMIGKPGKKFITIISLTQQQSRLILANIKRELETNELLNRDFGSFGEDEDEWRANSLVISQYQARIMALSAGESIRGFRHAFSRPDLIICDDVEDLESVKTQESRDKTYRWLVGDVIPMGDQSTKVVVIGNLLHEDSLIMRLKDQIEKNSQNSIFKSYPLVDSENQILWKGKYPDQKALDTEKSRIGEVAWKREYLLIIVPDNDCVVRPEWIHYYDKLPNLDESEFRFSVTSVDLAISEKDSADHTAMLTGYVFGYGDSLRTYIQPFPVNKHLNFPDTIEEIKKLWQKHKDMGLVSKIFIEEVGYQSALPQQLTRGGITTMGVKVSGQDKRARLSQTTSWIEQGKILFPKVGAENLINQLVGFGVERHDDLADAFSMMVLELMKDTKSKARVLGPESECYRFFHSIG